MKQIAQPHACSKRAVYSVPRLGSYVTQSRYSRAMPRSSLRHAFIRVPFNSRASFYEVPRFVKIIAARSWPLSLFSSDTFDTSLEALFRNVYMRLRSGLDVVVFEKPIT